MAGQRARRGKESPELPSWDAATTHLVGGLCAHLPGRAGSTSSQGPSPGLGPGQLPFPQGSPGLPRPGNSRPWSVGQRPHGAHERGGDGRAPAGYPQDAPALGSHSTRGGQRWPWPPGPSVSPLAHFAHSQVWQMEAGAGCSVDVSSNSSSTPGSWRPWAGNLNSSGLSIPTCTRS